MSQFKLDGRHGLVVLLLSLSFGLVPSCGGDERIDKYDYPEGAFSTSLVDFGTIELNSSVSRTLWFENTGDLTMGVGSIALGTSDESSHFDLSWSTAEMECPESTDTSATEAEAKAVMDSGGTEPEDTGDGPTDTDDTEVPVGVEMLLDPGCQIPLHITFTPTSIGTLYGSVILETVTETVAETETPSYVSDPDNERRMVYLVGTAERGQPNINVSPRSFDYGHLWSGSRQTAFFAIRNTGDGDLTLSPPVLHEDCDAGFEITNLETGMFQSVLAGGEATFVEVDFTAPDIDAAYCDLDITSSDADSPAIEISLQANAGQDPNNHAPTVSIRSPGNGYQHLSRDSIQMELNIFDVDQPADTLTCKVKSMVMALASVATCTATDESGHVMVEVPLDELDVGVDTLRVQVTDFSEVTSYASISVLINASYDDSDDDGDGWGEEADEEGNYDCNDSDINTYPYAAEIADGIDNDCDGLVDENTSNYDDDGDSFTEATGDCNDQDDEVYPGALEQPDRKDNNCDGVIDDGTSLFDDDEDGYTEMNADCDDDDPEINPSAIEYCDGIDNDCNGLKDEQDGCIELNSEPYIVGGVYLQRTACESNEQVTVSVLAYDADGQSLEYSWTGDEGVTIEPLTGSATVTVTCPEVDSPTLFGMYVVITDDDGHQIWDFDDLGVYPEGGLDLVYKKYVSDSKSCSAIGAGSGFWLAGLALAFAARRRRERED